MASIHNRAVMVKISISQFNPKRQDAKTTQEVLRDKHASRQAGAWVKNLVNPNTLIGITNKAQQARQTFYRLTVPWTDEGWRLLPITLYDKFHAQMRENRRAFEQEVEQFVNKWDEHIAEAKINLNGMFDASAYPSAEGVAAAFGFSVNVQPIPSGADFRISLQDDELAQIKQDTDERVKLAEQQAMQNVWQRLAEPITKLIDKLKDDESIFRNSLVENLSEILDLIPALNLTQDTTLNQFAQECRAKLTAQTPDALRDSPTIRKRTLAEAEAIMQRMRGYLT